MFGQFRQHRHRSCWLIRLALASAIAASPPIAMFAQGPVVRNTTPPPDRNPDDPNDSGDNKSCPPGPSSGEVGAPNASLGDSDVDGDGELDYFMGEWEYVITDMEETTDTKIRKWCLNQGIGFYSYEILTSKNGVDATKIAGGGHL